jgi:conjugative transfer pilus assembly protein TraH
MIRIVPKRLSVFLLVFIILPATQSYASGIDRLMKYASPNGTMSNETKSAIIKDQQGGYMTGGSILLRGPKPKTLQPLVIQTPRFAFDACTGSADFRFGGLSYVSAKEFSAFLKSMSTAAGAYAVKMLVKSACPQCEDIMSYLESVARDVNGMMLDQCSAGQAIAGGAYGALTNAGQQKCMMQSNMTNNSRDMYESTDKCKANPDRFGNTGEEDELKSLLGDEFNLVWKAITRGEGDDVGFKELIMSVSGTIIGRKIDGRYHFTPKPSLVLSNDLLEQYIGISGGKATLKLYKCDTKEKCLAPKEKETTLEQTETLYGNISRILEGLVTKVMANKGEQLSDEEEAVIAFSSIPLINLIEMELASKARSVDTLVRMGEFVEVVCYDIITNFLQQMVTKAQVSVEALEYTQIADIKPIREFTERAEKVKEFLRDKRFEGFKRLQVITQVKERLVLQEKAFENGFSRFMQQTK